MDDFSKFLQDLIKRMRAVGIQRRLKSLVKNSKRAWKWASVRIPYFWRHEVIKKSRLGWLQTQKLAIRGYKWACINIPFFWRNKVLKGSRNGWRQTQKLSVKGYQWARMNIPYFWRNKVLKGSRAGWRQAKKLSVRGYKWACINIPFFWRNKVLKGSRTGWRQTQKLIAQGYQWAGKKIPHFWRHTVIKGSRAGWKYTKKLFNQAYKWARAKIPQRSRLAWKCTQGFTIQGYKWVCAHIPYFWNRKILKGVRTGWKRTQKLSVHCYKWSRGKLSLCVSELLKKAQASFTALLLKLDRKISSARMQSKEPRVASSRLLKRPLTAIRKRAYIHEIFKAIKRAKSILTHSLRFKLLRDSQGAFRLNRKFLRTAIRLLDYVRPRYWARILTFLMPFRSHYVKTPNILQMEMTECGAAALGMVLGYYGRHVPLEELRIRCGVSRNGSRAIHMVKAARHYGLTARGLQVDDLESLRTLKAPFIVFWEFNHFVVVEGWGNKGFYINDPAVGRRQLSVAEFDKAFTGVVLDFEPGHEFRREGRPTSVVSFLRNIIRHMWGKLTYIILISLILAVPKLVSAGFIKVFVDDILLRQNDGWLRPLLWIMVITAIASALLTWLQETHQLRLNLRLAVDNTVKFIWHVFRLPLSFFYQRFVGDILTRIQANDHILSVASQGVATAIANLFSTIFFWIILMMINVPLALIALAGTIAHFGILYVVSPRIAAFSFVYQQEYSKFFSCSLSGLKMIESIKGSASESVFLKKWRQLWAKSLKQLQDSIKFENVAQIFSKIVSAVMNIAILFVGAWLIIRGQMTLGTLLAFQSLLGQLITPLGILFSRLEEIQTLRGDVTRLEDTLRHPLDPMFANESQDIKLPASIQVNNVSFGYSWVDPCQVEGINFELKPGKQLAIVGATGSGKSTIASLLVGFYAPWKGKIFLGDKNLATISSEQRAKIISLVDNESGLFDGTVQENLTLGNTNITDETLKRVIRETQAEEIVEGLGGLQGRITEGGTNLSQGQRQRLEIARALASDPSILVLDEATTGLDAVTEQKVLENLKARDLSLVIISHRLSSIRDSDHIIVLEDGRVAEQGRHPELIRNQHLYHQLMSIEQ